MRSISAENKEKSEENDDSNVRDEKTEISRLFGTKQKCIYRCLKCNEEKIKTNILLVCNLLLNSSNRDVDIIHFNQVLRQSLSVEKTTPAFCETCKKFTPTNQTTQTRELPKILSINCGLTSDKEMSFLRRQMNRSDSSTPQPTTSSTPIKPCRYGANCSRVDCHFAHPDRKSPQIANNTSITSTSSSRTSPWFPLQFSMEIDRATGELIVNDVINGDAAAIESISEKDVDASTLTEDLSDLNVTDEAENSEEKKNDTKADEKANEKKLYKLSAVVCQIINGTQKNLVSLIHVDSEYHRLKSSDSNANSQWYVFNDFSIAPVSVQEATWFTLDWKVPCVLFYSSIDATDSDLQLSKSQFDDNPFLHVRLIKFRFKVHISYRLCSFGIFFRTFSVNKFAKIRNMISHSSH